MFFRQILLCISLVLNVLLLYKLVWSEDGIIAYQGLKEQYTSLHQKITELDQKNLALSKEIRLLQSDDKYIDAMIRKRLNFVKDNEILYIFSDKEAADKDATKPGAGPDEAKN